ncbi:MAG: sugar ABC transporter permease [Caldilineaceae bacterium]|nr:sugar ABC transporter permease [Caldilineaceae bacterium]
MVNQQAQMGAGNVVSRRKPLWQRPDKWLAGYLFVGPAVILLIVFSIISIGISLYLSFFDYDIISRGGPFVGLGNYREALFKDELFWTALLNTALYALGVVPGITIFAFLLAFAGHRVMYGKGVFRTIYFLPSITPLVVISLVWVWLYSPQGMFNQMLARIGVSGPNWLMEPQTSLISVIIMSIWVHVGYYVVIYLAGLADIPRDFYDAAKVDGANTWQEIIYITVPLLRNVTLFVTVTLAIGAFQVFTQIYIMTLGGPGSATTSMQLLIFRQGFQYFRMGYASALSWLLFAVIFVLVAIQLRTTRSEQIF